MAPNTGNASSESIIDIVFGVAPERGESRGAGQGSSPGERAFAVFVGNEVNKILDLGLPRGGEAR